MRLLRLLDLDQVHIVHHPTLRTDEAAIGEEIMDRHVAHLGNDPLRLVAAKRVNSLKIMCHHRIDTGLRLGRHDAASREETL
jgi:hypothetical protein